MGYLQQCTDLRHPDSDPELFAIALALCHIRALIQHGGSKMRRPDDDSALHPHHLEAVQARAVGRTCKDKCMAQEWCRLKLLFFPRAKEAWERSKTLFQEDLDQAKGKEHMDSFSMIDFAVDGYPYSLTRRNWAINGYRLMWREHFLKDQERGECTERSL